MALTIAVVSGDSLSSNGTFKGVCSSYLQAREPGDTVFGFVKSPSNSFFLPSDPMVPVIMIGPGTGVAPFRGFLEERQMLSKQGKALGKASLYFGCRRPEHDFIYQAELEHYHQSKIATLHVAFSHIENSKYPFVQHLLRKNAAEVWLDLQNGAHVYVCGDGLFMAPQVRETIVSIVEKEGNMSLAEAESFVTDLEDQQRYCVDVFGQKKN
jgi:cytochrome P450/NADPH-cytochrome P450 reductase